MVGARGGRSTLTDGGVIQLAAVLWLASANSEIASLNPFTGPWRKAIFFRASLVRKLHSRRTFSIFKSHSSISWFACERHPARIFCTVPSSSLCFSITLINCSMTNCSTKYQTLLKSLFLNGVIKELEGWACSNISSKLIKSAEERVFVGTWYQGVARIGGFLIWPGCEEGARMSQDRFDWAGSSAAEEERDWGCASWAAADEEEERTPSLPALMSLFTSVQNWWNAR